MRERDSPSPVNKPMSNDENEEDVDPYEALDVSTTAPAARGNELLDAFEDNDDQELLGEEEAIALAESSAFEMNDTIELNSEIETSFLVEDEIVEEEDDVDPFEELGASRPASIDQEDPMVSDALAAFMDDDEEEEETEEASEEETLDEVEEKEVEEVANERPRADPEELYRFLLEGVWVDDVLDPAEVTLMAKKRRELNISFETHLKILREVLHE